MNDYFQFRQFRVSHRRSSMKVGTDAVLLGAWADVSGINTVLDAGTGTGVIALMLAQRTAGQVKIDAVEIDHQAASDAYENFSVSPWTDSMHLFHTPLQHFIPRQKYDLIISNPPFFVNSLKPPDASRKVARHTDSMKFDDLIALAIKYLQRPTGRLAIILPPAEGALFTRLAAANGLFLNRECTFRTRTHKPPERKLMEFSFIHTDLQTEVLCLYEHSDVWSAPYKELTAPFYLKG
ncbi:MAG: methyltransferase [Flammeovirgaceae bacterium]|nr:MAG: methyltransferase [Flammeovirgaceae bacterium]